jgi:uncharacterized protein with HEPN domain/predicted nucleotidyltransferase
MTRQDAIAALRQQAGALKALGATELYLFGSTARDDADLESDLDLFIDYDRGSRFSLVELVGVKQLLERPPWRSGRCDDPRQPGSAAQGPNRGFGRARFLTERLVRPALHAVRKAIAGIEQAVRGKTLDDFRADWLLRHGVQRGIEIISEAARRIPPELQARQPNIPWAQIMGIGNVLRHEYHRVSDTLIWNVVQDYLPLLKPPSRR